MDSKVKTYIQTKQQPDVLNYDKFSDFARDDLIYKADEAVSAKVLDGGVWGEAMTPVHDATGTAAHLVPPSVGRTCRCASRHPAGSCRPRSATTYGPADTR